MTAQLLTIALYLPFGLLLATVVLEFFAAKRRSTEGNNAVIAALKVSAFGIALAAGAAAYVKTQNVAGVSIPFGNWMIGAGVFGLAIIALFLKILCRKKNIKGFPTRLHGRRTKGASGGKALLLGTYRLVLAAAFLGLFAGVAVVANENTKLASAEIAGSGEGEDSKPEATPEPAPTPEPAVVVKTPKPEPAPDPTPMPEPEPEPTVVTTTPEPEPAPEPIPTPMPEPTPVVAVADPNNPFNSPDAIIIEPEPGMADAPEPNMTSDPATPVIAKIEPEPEPMATPAPTTAAPSDALKKSRSDYYVTLIQPLFRGRCYDCHDAEKQKGDLRLDSPAAIRAGGKSGPIVVPGKPEKSSVYTLCALPEDDPDIMPSKGKPLTTAQVGYIKTWITDGAELGDGKSWPGMEGVVFTSTEEGAVTLAPEVTSLIEKLKSVEVGVKEIPGEPGMYEVDYSHAGLAEGQLHLEVLKPLADHLHTLDLKKTKVVDGDLQHIAEFEKLTKLNLALTKVSDTGISHLKKLENLTYLNLYGTEVGDRSITYLKDLEKLTKLFLWNSKVSQNGVTKLKKSLPKTDISFGG